MKLRLLLVACGLIFSMPGFAAANHHMMPDGFKPTHGEIQGERHHHMDHHHNWQAKMQEREQKILTWVDQYTPEKKAEWSQVFAERKTLMSQWLSPENKAKRDKWKEQKMAKWKEWKKLLDEGKISKEEFFKKTHKGMKMKYWQTYRDLEVAVQENDQIKAAKYLNQLLEQCKEHNVKMKDMLKK